MLVSGFGALPAHASLPLSFDHIAGLPRHTYPESVAVDATGNVYVADSAVGNTMVDDRVAKYDASGTFLDVVAGPGATAGSLVNPVSVAIAPSGNLYVLEAGYGASGASAANNRVSQFDALGNYLGSWGAYGTGNGLFKTPKSIAVDSAGNVYVADYNRVQKFDASGGWINSWTVASVRGLAVDAGDVLWIASTNTMARYSTAGTLQNSWTSSGATGVGTGAAGIAWVSSTSGVVRQYDASGNLLATLGSTVLSVPEGVAVNGGTLYVADTGNGRVARFSIPKVDTSWASSGVRGVALDGGVVYGTGGGNVQTYDTSGTPGTSWASSGASGVAADGSGNTWVSSTSGDVVRQYDATGALLATIGTGQLLAPQGVAFAAGKVFVADTGNNRIVRYATDGTLETSWALTGVTGVAVNGSVVYAAAAGNLRTYDTSGVAGVFWASAGATGVAIDGSGNVWVSSSAGVVREYSSAGTFLMSIGSGVLSGPQGVFAAAGGKVWVADTGNDRIVRFSTTTAYQLEWGEYPAPGVEDLPTGLAVDGSGNVYVTNKAQDVIQKYDASGAFLLQWGGTGSTPGLFDNPAAIAVSPSGDVYVADTDNMRVQRFDADGNFLAQWGSFGTSNGQFSSPAGIAVDSTGAVYVADTGNHRVEKFGAGGSFVSVWGTSAPAFSCSDGAFRSPKGIAVDGSGNIWVADSGNNRVQEFDAGGAWIKAWGANNASCGSSSLDGKLKGPSDIDFDAQGTMWIADRSNNRLQRFTTTGVFLSKIGSLGLDVAQFDAPSSVVVDGSGRVLVADTNNHRVQVFIDANGPDVTFSTGPSTVSSATSASFSFTANEPGATFECRLDGGGYSSCTSPNVLSSLTEGAHTAYVRASDALANVGNPATYDWTVDLTAPSVAIDTTPGSPTASTSASFTYHSSESNSTYLCSLDGTLPASACGASFSQTVANGDHTFSVWAIDQAGNQSGVPATYSWTVDTTPPVVHINSGPSGIVKSTSASFTFDSPDAGATFKCHLDGAAYSACTSPQSYSGLSAGQHVFYVRGTDALGNISPDKTQTWTVDLADHRPDAQIATGSTYVGNGVYNTTGKNQTKTLKTKANNTVTFKIRVENDGTDTDSYTFDGAGSVNGYTVTYKIGFTDYTTKITNGTLTISVAPGAYKLITMSVKVSSKGNASYSSLITATSGHDGTRVDAVKAVIKRV